MTGPSHPFLDDHAAIAWDLDGTLIDGPKQAFLGAYVRGRRDKRHHLATFRRPSQRPAVVAALASVGLDANLFDALHFCPEQLRDAFDSGGETSLVREFRRWKGSIAAAHGCTVLVDDDADLVGEGCRLHAVVHVDSWSSRFPTLRPAPGPGIRLLSPSMSNTIQSGTRRR
ncbi:hypothetical protein [Methylobacterium radiotolerans]|uniref:hypothetical protein n=1 Tax=Methylobacterium radiotolerans TaxID=31998 RepID=UPI0038D171BC